MYKQLEIRRRLIEASHFLAPDGLRAVVRSNETGLILLAAIVGVISGILITGMSRIAQGLHRIVFGISSGQWLSSVNNIAWPKLILGPVIGGIFLGLFVMVTSKSQRGFATDPIEANALHGGKISLVESFQIAIQNLISNGFGASVGLEAGYTQISSGIASRIGLAFKMRRKDCESAWNKDPLEGLSASKKDPSIEWVQSVSWTRRPDWNVGCGNDCKDQTVTFWAGQGDHVRGYAKMHHGRPPLWWSVAE